MVPLPVTYFCIINTPEGRWYKTMFYSKQTQSYNLTQLNWMVPTYGFCQTTAGIIIICELTFWLKYLCFSRNNSKLATVSSCDLCVLMLLFSFTASAWSYFFWHLVCPTRAYVPGSRSETFHSVKNLPYKLAQGHFHLFISLDWEGKFTAKGIV